MRESQITYVAEFSSLFFKKEKHLKKNKMSFYFLKWLCKMNIVRLHTGWLKEFILKVGSFWFKNVFPLFFLTKTKNVLQEGH